jgi:DNA-binding PadR family transcriptional regulator
MDAKLDWPALILAVLADGPRHGYDIAREVERRAHHEFTLPHGTLYPMLHQLERDGSVVSEWEDTLSERKRRLYCLTDQGREDLERRLNRFRTVGRVLGLTVEAEA